MLDAYTETDYAPAACTLCNGTGYFDGDICKACSGQGTVLASQPARDCPICGGSGQSENGICKACKGSGWARF